MKIKITKEDDIVKVILDDYQSPKPMFCFTEPKLEGFNAVDKDSKLTITDIIENVFKAGKDGSILIINDGVKHD